MFKDFQIQVLGDKIQRNIIAVMPEMAVSALMLGVLQYEKPEEPEHHNLNQRVY